MEDERIELQEKVEEIEKAIDEGVKPKLNRAQRRAKERANRKGYRNDMRHLDNISEAAKKMVFAELIQRLRKMNSEKEKEKENDSTEEN